MATQTVEFRAATGLTLTVQLFAVGSDTIVQTASSCTEATNRKGTYAAVFTDPGAAEFELVALSGGVPVCRWFVTLTLSTATFQAYEVKAAGVVDKSGFGLTQAQTASAVWDALIASYTVSGSFGARILRTDAASAGNGLKVTGAGHGAADIHELQPAVITSAAFAAGWLTADGTAADYVTELQTALGTATNQTAILDRVSFALSVLAGACSDAQTAAETYVLSIGGNTYTVDYSGLDASGNRSTTTLTKA